MDTSTLTLSAARRVHDNDELRREICDHLNEGELPNCARVSKKWLETSSEVVWRVISLRQFMSLMEDEISQDSSRASLSSAAIYMSYVRQICVYVDDLDLALPCARLIMLLYPHIQEMKGRPWVIDFVTHTIESSRVVVTSEPILAIGRICTLPGFTVKDKMLLTPIRNQAVPIDEAVAQDILERKEDVRWLSLDDIISFNTQPAEHLSASTTYSPIVDAVIWIETDQQSSPRPEWWNGIPRFRHLDALTYFDTRHGIGQYDISGIYHLLRNKYMKTLDIQFTRMDLSQVPDIVDHALKRMGSALTVRLSVSVSTGSAVQFEAASKRLLDKWHDEGISSDTPRSDLSFECSYDNRSRFASTDELEQLRQRIEIGVNHLCRLPPSVTFRFIEGRM